MRVTSYTEKMQFAQGVNPVGVQISDGAKMIGKITAYDFESGEATIALNPPMDWKELEDFGIGFSQFLDYEEE